ncbi:hypothetical protein D3C79_1041890 [compost metagenome]
MRHQGVANVQFIDTLDRRHRLDVVVMQPVASIDDQPLPHTKRHAINNTLQLLGHFGRGFGIGVTPGMQLDGRRTHPP